MDLRLAVELEGKKLSGSQLRQVQLFLARSEQIARSQQQVKVVVMEHGMAWVVQVEWVGGEEYSLVEEKLVELMQLRRMELESFVLSSLALALA